MPSSQPQQPEGIPSWPPNFASYTNSSTQELIKAIESESKNTKAPDHYREFMQHLAQEIKEDEKEIKKLTDKANLYSTYVKTTEQTYNTLAQIHKEERKRSDDLEELLLQTQEKLNQFVKHMNSREEVFAQTKTLYETNLVQREEHYSKAASRQAQGRKNIEETLFAKEMELADTKRKLRDMEIIASDKQKEVEKFQQENIQLRQLVAYLHNPQQLGRQTQQQQQQHIPPRNYQ